MQEAPIIYEINRPIYGHSSAVASSFEYRPLLAPIDIAVQFDLLFSGGFIEEKVGDSPHLAEKVVMQRGGADEAPQPHRVEVKPPVSPVEHLFQLLIGDKADIVPQ